MPAKPSRSARSRDAAAPTPDVARGRSSRRQAAESAADRRGGSTARRPEGERRPASSRVVAADRSSASPRAKASERGRGASSAKQKPAGRGSQRATNAGSQRRVKQPPSTIKRVLTWSLLVVVALIVVGLILTPGILRSMKAAELAAAEPVAVDGLAREYLERIRFDGSTIDRFITQYSDAPLATGLRLIEIAHLESEGRVARFDILMVQANRPDLSHLDRAAILELAAHIYRPNQHRSSFVPRQLIEWAKPASRPDPERRTLALAALDLMVVLVERSELRVDQTLSELASDANADSRLIEAAVHKLASITNSTNVGFAMNLLVGPNADAASRHQPLLDAIYTNVRAAHIPSILRLWESPIDAVAATGFRAIGGPGVVLSDNDSAQREEIGQRIAGMLSQDLLRQSPVRFSGLLDAVLNLRLSGTRVQLLALVPDMPAEMQDRVATILASFVRDGGDDQQAVNEDTTARVAAALTDPARRGVAAQVLQRLRFGNGVVGLRSALDAAVAHGDDAQVMAGIHHVVKEIYRRQDVIDQLGTDVGRWQAFMEQDRPRFEYFRDAQEWYAENRGKTRVADGDTIPANRARAEEVQPELQRWIEDTRTPIPLGLTRKQVEDFHHAVNTLKRNLIHSDVRR